MITLGQIMGTQTFGICFMGLMIGGSIWTVIWEVCFSNKYPTVKARKGIV